MAKLSRNARKKARVRRNLSMANRSLRQVQRAYFNTQLTLLMVLAQSGGEKVVTKGTMQQTLEQLNRLGWQSFPGENENEFVVRLLTKPEEEPRDPQDVFDAQREAEFGNDKANSNKVQMVRLPAEDENPTLGETMESLVEKVAGPTSISEFARQEEEASHD
jgi:hypothetical protein